MIRDAGYELYQQNNQDAAKTELYDKACEALHTGANYTHMAGYLEASGNTEEAVIYYGLATSQYTLAMKYAQAAGGVHNAIFD